MQVGIDYGTESIQLEVAPERVRAIHREPPIAPLIDPEAALGDALEKPLGFPALRRALTPDDHVTIVVDERLPHLGRLLVPVLEHISRAQVALEAITLLCPPSSTAQVWFNELPTDLQEIRLVIHDPTDRQQLAYLATTRRGHRVYLNRNAVDADQLVVLTRCAYDPLLGYADGVGAIYPWLSDEESRKETWDRLSLAVPGSVPWPARQEAAEVAWLLGAPFMVQVIEGAGDEVAHIVCGMADTGVEALRLHDRSWRVEIDEPADIVVASVSGDPARLEFADLARALACAARVVKSNGRIVILSQLAPSLGEGAELLRQADDPTQALGLLRRQRPTDMAAAFKWASAGQKAALYLLSELPSDTVEELFATPLEHAGQVQRLIGPDRTCVFIPDAHKTMAVLRGSADEE